MLTTRPARGVRAHGVMRRREVFDGHDTLVGLVEQRDGMIRLGTVDDPNRHVRVYWTVVHIGPGVAYSPNGRPYETLDEVVAAVAELRATHDDVTVDESGLCGRDRRMLDLESRPGVPARGQVKDWIISCEFPTFSVIPATGYFQALSALLNDPARLPAALAYAPVTVTRLLAYRQAARTNRETTGLPASSTQVQVRGINPTAVLHDEVSLF